MYILVARKIYTNIYLYEQNLSPLQTQQHNYKIEQIINECILNAVRESIPVASILRSYLDETSETIDLSPDTIIKNKLDAVINSVASSDIGTSGVEGVAATQREGDVSGTGFGVDVGVESVFKPNELVTVPVIEPALKNLMITPQQPLVDMIAPNEIAKSVSFEDDSGLKIGDDVRLSHDDIESIGQKYDEDSNLKIEFTSL